MKPFVLQKDEGEKSACSSLESFRHASISDVSCSNPAIGLSEYVL